MKLKDIRYAFNADFAKVVMYDSDIDEYRSFSVFAEDVQHLEVIEISPSCDGEIIIAVE